MRHLVLAFVLILLAGCFQHVDSAYLGRAEADLLAAVNRGDLAAVEKFLDQGGNVNLQDEPGMTPLHHAVNADSHGSHVEIVKLLIERGANVNVIDDTHHTPLHMASHSAVAELLIESGANVNAKTLREGETLLFSAAWGAAQGHPKSHQSYLDLTMLLITSGADVNVKLESASVPPDEKPYHAKAGDTPLHKVARSYAEEYAVTVCEVLILNGAQVNERNIRGLTPLDEALANQRMLTADFLREQEGETTEELGRK